MAASFNRRDIERSLPADYVGRGARYVREGRVLEVSRRTDSPGFRGLVDGTADAPYRVEVDVLHGSAGPRIYGRCTCPIAVNCKHVAAVLIAIAEGHPVARPPAGNAPGLMPAVESAPGTHRTDAGGGGVLPPGWLNWLNDAAERVVLAEREHATDPAAQRLLYVIGPVPAFQRPGVRVQTFTARPKKTGGLSTPRAWGNARNAIHAPPSFVTPQDVRLLRRLLVEANMPFDSEFVLRGEGAPELIGLLLETGRCFAEEIGDTPLQRGEPRKASPAWSHEADGMQRITWRADPPISAVLPVTPPWYLDTGRHACGPLDTGADPLTAYLTATLPPIEAEQVGAVRALIENRLPALHIPLPSVPLETDVLDLPPVPCLRLLTVELRVAYRVLDPALTIAVLRFDYGGSRVGPGDPGIVRQFQGGSLRRIRRDAKREKRFHEVLRKAGFRRLSESRPPVRGEFEHDYRFEHEGEWVDFVFDDIPTLRAAGWVVEYDENFAYRPAQVGDWHAKVDDDGHGWFDLSLGIDIDGKRVDLLPIVVALLRSRPELLRSAVGAEGEPKRAAVRLEDGRLLPVPLERLKPMMSVLDELLDSGPTKKVRLPRTDALRLAALNATGQIRWQGGEDLRALGERLARFGEIVPVPVPASLKATLRGYQAQGLAWLQFLRQYGFGGVLADDMGLGKTVQAIAHLLVEKEAERLDLPALIVAPTSVVPNWRNEVARFAPSLRVHVSHGLKRKDALGQLAKNDLVITSYPLLARDRHALMAQPFHLVILDEAQQIKNAQTQAANVVRALKSRHRLCLTGTPLENHLGELWSLFHFLMPGFLGDATSFRRMYRTPIEKHDDAFRRASLERRVRPFLLRRTKETVASELPKKTEVVSSVELVGGQRELYETVRTAMDDRVRREIANRGLAQSQIVVLDALLKLRQVCCDPRLVKLDAARDVRESAKFDALFDMLDSLLAEGRRVLLFSQFTEMLALIEAELGKRGMPSVKLTGDTRDRETPVRAFQDGKVPLFLISLKAGGTGLNLTAADTVIHYDPWWNPAVERQATDRAHRIGQDKPVFVYKPIATGSVEEKIAEMQSRKAALAEAILGDPGKASSPLTPDDIAALFAPLE